MELTLRSYAKINLSLDVLGVLENGYHEVSTVMQKTSLEDEIRLQWEDESTTEKKCGLRIILTCNKSYVPTDERNLAYRAAVLMHEGLNISGTLRIDLKKRIPISAGLAGGSGNAAAVLIGLNRIWNMGLDTKTLCQKGAILGSDVPFMVLVQNSRYRCALGTGRGEILTPIKKAFISNLVIAKPNFGVSTKEVYSGIDSCEIKKRPDTEKLIEAVIDEDNEKAFANMVNVLENYTLKTYPEVAKIKSELDKTDGVLKVIMSGSGPSVIGFYTTIHEAKNAAISLRNQGYEAYWLNTLR